MISKKIDIRSFLEVHLQDLKEYLLDDDVHTYVHKRSAYRNFLSSEKFLKLYKQFIAYGKVNELLRIELH